MKLKIFDMESPNLAHQAYKCVNCKDEFLVEDGSFSFDERFLCHQCHGQTAECKTERALKYNLGERL